MTDTQTDQSTADPDPDVITRAQSNGQAAAAERRARKAAEPVSAVRMDDKTWVTTPGAYDLEQTYARLIMLAGRACTPECATPLACSHWGASVERVKRPNGWAVFISAQDGTPLLPQVVRATMTRAMRRAGQVHS